MCLFCYRISTIRDNVVPVRDLFIRAHTCLRTTIIHSHVISYAPTVRRATTSGISHYNIIVKSYGYLFSESNVRATELYNGWCEFFFGPLDIVRACDPREIRLKADFQAHVLTPPILTDDTRRRRRRPVQVEFITWRHFCCRSISERIK